MNNCYYVIGVMSGTSLDGVDICYSKFTFNKQWKFKILKASTCKYDLYWRNKLSTAISLKEDQLILLDIEYSLYLSNLILNFILDNNVDKNVIICSHGHTVFHQPKKGITKQIGNRPELKTYLKYPIICDFRVQDVELGGQGAPLVPIGDKYLFYKYEYCLNLGGFANISFEHYENRIAFDICPVNIVLNHYCKELDIEYDDKGLISSRGEIHLELLEQLNSLDFYKKSYPKSLGLEWVKEFVLPIIDNKEIKVQDVLRTFIEHIAIQIGNVLKNKPLGNLFITGGGAYNTFLISRIKANLAHNIVIPELEIIDFKEALIFGFLGVLKLRNEPNCLQSVTGAIHDHSSGKIYK